MASAMMSSSSGTGTVADLAPGLSMGLKDDMWRLEAKGLDSDVKNPEKENIMFVRGEQQSSAVTNTVAPANPDEIDIDDDDEEEDDDNENEVVPKKAGNVEEMDVPDRVFGDLIRSQHEP